MPGVVIGSPASFVGEAWIGAPDSTPSGATVSPPAKPSSVTFPTQRIAFAYKPTAFGPSASPAVPSVRRTANPAAWSNVSAFQTARLTLQVKSASFANGQSFSAASLRRALLPAAFANGPTFFGPRLTLRISAAAYANASQVYAAGISQGSSTKAAPHGSSGAVFHAPTLILPAATSVTVTLSLPGMIPRAPKPPARRSTATWPNLPNVAAPPWRLTVVTPELARERARERLVSAKRAQRLRRKRKADQRSGVLVDALIDEAVASTIVRVATENP